MRLAVAGLAGLLLAALAGCSAPPPPEPTPTPTPTFASDPIVVSGAGPTDILAPIPEGAQSLTVVVACAGTSMVDVGLGGYLGDDRTGQCGGISTLVMPVTDASQGSLRVHLADGVAFTAQLEFSAAPVVPDPVLAEQCSTVGDVLSTVRNASDALSYGDSDTATWQTEIDGAVEQLGTIDTDTMVGHLVQPLADWLSAPTGAPEELRQAAPAAYYDAQYLIAQLCSDNGSTIAIRAEYGG